MGSPVVVSIPGGTGGGTAESTNDIVDAALGENNRLTLTRRSGTNPIVIDLTRFADMTAQEIADALFINDAVQNLTNNDNIPFPISEGSFTQQGGGSATATLGMLTQAQEDSIKNDGASLRVVFEATWDAGNYQRFDPAASLEVFYGTQRIGGITLVDGAAVKANFAITKNAADNATNRSITIRADARTRGGAAPNSIIGIDEAELHSPAPGYAEVVDIADASANKAVSPVARQAETNKDNIAINQRAIDLLKQKPNYNPTAAHAAFAGNLDVEHEDGDDIYTDPFTSVVRWLVGTGLSLDSDGVTINTSQRRALYGLGVENDKAYFVKTVSANTGSGGHLDLQGIPKR